MAAAQGVDTGSLRGRVTDGSGAALPGVTVTAASAAVMGGSLTAVTSGEGLYRFPSLPPGVYAMRMELTGFQPIALADVRINVGLALTIDRQMAGVVGRGDAHRRRRVAHRRHEEHGRPR